MWNKIYLAALGVAFIVIAFFSYYSWSWLQSRGNPVDAVTGYAYNAMIATSTLWLSTIVLLVLGNVLLWLKQSSRALWMTFIFFAVFTIVRSFWLDPAFFQFQNTAGLSDSSFSAGALFGVILIFLAGVIVFFDQFLVLRLHAKTYPPVTVPDEGEKPSD